MLLWSPLQGQDPAPGICWCILTPVNWQRFPDAQHHILVWITMLQLNLKTMLSRTNNFHKQYSWKYLNNNYIQGRICSISSLAVTEWHMSAFRDWKRNLSKYFQGPLFRRENLFSMKLELLSPLSLAKVVFCCCCFFPPYFLVWLPEEMQDAGKHLLFSPDPET